MATIFPFAPDNRVARTSDADIAVLDTASPFTCAADRSCNALSDGMRFGRTRASVDASMCRSVALTAQELHCLAEADRIALEVGLRRVLLVDADLTVVAALTDMLGERGTLVHAGAPADALALLMPDQFGLIILDDALDGALPFLEQATQRCPETAVLLYTVAAPEEACLAHASAVLCKRTTCAQVVQDMIGLLLEFAYQER